MKTFLRVMVGALLILLGLWVIFNPAITFVTISLILGVVIFAEGIADILTFLTFEKDNIAEVLSGIVNVIFGILIFSTYWVAALSANLAIIFGLWIVMKGILLMPKSAYLKKVKVENWGLILFGGILCIIVGIIMLFYRAFPAAAVSWIISISLIISGLATILSGGTTKNKTVVRENHDNLNR